MKPSEILKLLKEAEKMSTCQKRKVGAVLMLNGKAKYFGANKTMLNNKGICYACDTKFHSIKELCPAVHAEIDCLLKAGKEACGGTLLVSYSPCPECCKAIINAGIRHVVVTNFRRKPVTEPFWYLYEASDYDDLAWAMLKAAKIKYTRIGSIYPSDMEVKV